MLPSIRAAVVLVYGKIQSPDLIFADIQLGDGTSFEIFSQFQLTCPRIFTTAYDEYAIQAFKGQRHRLFA